MKPRLKITDPNFSYVSAAATDLRKTFAKHRKALKLAAAQREAAKVAEAAQEATDNAKVATIFNRRRQGVKP